MSNHPPQHVPPPAQVVEASDTSTPATQPPPGDQTVQAVGLPVSDQANEDERRAHMMAAGLTAMAGVRILAREEQAALEESAAANQERQQAMWSPQPGLLAKTIAWGILIFFGLGSIVLVFGFIITMFRG